MRRPTVPFAKYPELVSAGAAFCAGILLGVRPRESRTRIPLLLSAGALGAIALLRPSGNAVRNAGKRRRAGQVRFSLVIPRPVEQVFALCADFENFPRILRSVQRVIDYGDGRSHWCALTPAGNGIEWDTVTTKFMTNSVIAWRSVPGGPITMSGMLRFKPDGDGTCVRIAIEYEVKSSSLRDAMAALLAPRAGPVLEQEIRAMAKRMADEPEALVRDVPPVVSSSVPAPLPA